MSQLEELILLEVSALEAARESLAEMIGQVDEVVSGGGPVSRSVCSLPSLCTSPAKPCPVPAGRRMVASESASFFNNDRPNSGRSPRNLPASSTVNRGFLSISFRRASAP